MKKLFRLLAATAIYLVSATFAYATCVATEDGTGVQSYTLLAGQTIDSGQVSAQVNGSNLDVTYSTTDGWTLNEVHLWVGENITDMPQTRKGKPIPGQFPYAAEGLDGSTTYTISIPVTDLAFACPGDDKNYLVAAHAALSKTHSDGGTQSETGWSDGARFSEKGNWATYSTLTLTCNCGSGPVDGTCETSFAYSPQPEGTCFLDIDEDGDSVGDFSRWGWSIGPLSPGTNQTYELYAGAGQCDTGKGTLVGTVTVDYDGATATVTTTLDAPYTMKDNHVYVGNDILARDNRGFFTVAPGKYPSVNDNPDSMTETVSFPASGQIYVVSHATVCGF